MEAAEGSPLAKNDMYLYEKYEITSKEHKDKTTKRRWECFCVLNPLLHRY